MNSMGRFQVNIRSGLRTYGWAVNNDLQELLEVLRSLYRKDFQTANVRTENGVDLVQIIADCNGCDSETITGVHACLSFWNMQQVRKLGLEFRPSVLTGKVKPCRECEERRKSELQGRS